MTTTYDRPAVSVNDQGIIQIRASQADDCGRELWYSGMQYPKSDDVTPEAQARMDMGNALEPVVVELMKNHYEWNLISWGAMHKWGVGLDGVRMNVPPYLTVTINEDLQLTATPDALGKHFLCDNKATAVEIKTRNTEQYRRAVNQGNIIAHYAAVAQLSIYRAGMIEVGLIDGDTDCALATMNKDTGEIYTEWFQPDMLDKVFLDAADQLLQWVSTVMTSEDPPERDFEPQDWQCKGCEWRTICWDGVEFKPKELDLSVEITQEELADAFAQWEEFKSAEVKMDDKVDKAVKAMFQRYMEGQNVEKMPMTGETGKYNVSIRVRDNTKLNADKVRYYLTKDQLEDCLEPSETRYVEIRKASRRSSD